MFNNYPGHSGRGHIARARLTMLHMIQLKRAYSKLGAYFRNHSLILSIFVYKLLQSTISNIKNSKKMYPYLAFFMFLRTFLGKAVRDKHINLYVKRAYKCLIRLCI